MPILCCKASRIISASICNTPANKLTFHVSNQKSNLELVVVSSFVRYLHLSILQALHLSVSPHFRQANQMRPNQWVEIHSGHTYDESALPCRLLHKHVRDPYAEYLTGMETSKAHKTYHFVLDQIVPVTLVYANEILFHV